jgi:hypothetical protein
MVRYEAMRTVVLFFLALLAATCLLLSAAIDVWTYFERNPDELWPSIWLLHLGIFVVLIPAAMFLPAKAAAKNVGWRDVMKSPPRALRWLTVWLVAYALFSVAAFEQATGGAGGPTHEADGSYAITSHGRVIRVIDEKEYRHARACETRSFTAWWMAGYSFTLTLLVAGLLRRNRPVGRASAAPIYSSGQIVDGPLLPQRGGGS